MLDVLTKEQRSYCMSRIRGKNTVPELVLRKAISSSGLRGYRLHYKIPGKPDIVFPRLKIAVFIDGCFWHRCPKCFIKPTTNSRFWMKKITSNAKRDRLVNIKLRRNGWRVLRVWEHDARNQKIIKSKVVDLIKNGS